MVSTAGKIPAGATATAVRIPAAGVQLQADVVLPAQASSVVIFAHGSGSGRHSSRNRDVANVLQQQRIATVLADLLTAAEEEVDQHTRHLRFDIPLLAGRLAGIATWAWQQPELRDLPCGYFGASTGAAAALIAAAGRDSRIRAVVSRGGRPDLARDFLPQVKAPTLLLVGSLDHDVLRLNQQALALLNSDSVLEVIARASHLFEEEGTLQVVAQKAAAWFAQHLG